MLSKSDLETLAAFGYDKPELLKLVARDIEKKGRTLLNLIEPGSATTPVPPKAAARTARSAKPAAKPAAKTNGAPAKPTSKRVLTPEARANIIAAQKARWANYHAGKGSAA